VSDIIYRPYRPSDEPDLRAMFGAVYGLNVERKTSAWRYLAPAPYPAVIQVAEVDGRIVGAQPSHAIDLLIEGEAVRGLLLLDVMTHPDYRRRGVFAGVVEGLRERASGEGYRVLLTTPNRDAERGFARLPAWLRMGELVPWVSITDAAALFSAKSRWGVLLRPLDSLWHAMSGRRRIGTGKDLNRYPGDRFTDALWSSIANASACHVVRDPRFVSWRFGTGSGRPYSFLSAGAPEHPEALVTSGDGRFFGRQVLTLVDMMVEPASPESGARLLRTIAEKARHEHRAAVVGWFAPGSGSERTLRGAGFLRVPKMLRPRPYAVWGWSDLPGERGARVLDLKSWFMSLADSDLA